MKGAERLADPTTCWVVGRKRKRCEGALRFSWSRSEEYLYHSFIIFIIYHSLYRSLFFLSKLHYHHLVWFASGLENLEILPSSPLPFSLTSFFCPFFFLPLPLIFFFFAGVRNKKLEVCCVVLDKLFNLLNFLIYKWA